MKIGLVDVDGHNFPNLALMKISAYHKKRGDIENILQEKKAAVLMDNNILAADCCQEQLEKIAKIGCKVDFNQGLDARIIVSNPQVPTLLSKIKWLAPIRLACDSKAMIPIIKEAADLLRGAGCKPHRLFSYVLLTDLEDSLERINFLRQMDIMPFAQPYRDFTPNQIIPQWQKDLAHWTNRRELLTSCEFQDFQPRRGFYCSEYFK